MTPTSFDDMERRLRAVERMLSLLRALLASRASRSKVTAFTRELWPDTSKQGGPFPGNACASTVFDSIWNIEERHGDDYLLREADLAHHMRLLTEGEPFAGAPRVAWVKGTADALAKSLSRSTARFWVDGLGWHESVSFSSPYTGRAFLAIGPLEPFPEPPAVDIHATEPAGVEVITDLLDTLGIDLDDLVHPPALAVGSWSLWRQDDNGVRELVARFSGRVKARRALERFERLHHRQMYWLEDG